MIVAIVPAAGKSQRMGQPKLLLPLGSRRVIEHVLEALTHSPVDRSFVVLPPAADELSAVVRRFARVEAVPLDVPTRDMRSSVLYGLEHVEATRKNAAPDAFLVALADQPTISPDIVRYIIERFLFNRPPIVIPTHAGKRGHPVLFSWSMITQIRAIPSDCGLDQLISQSHELVAECPVAEPSVLDDMDTPEDYAGLRRDWQEGK